jgi:hypothetical protein
MFPKGILIFLLCGFLFGLLPSVPYALLMVVTTIVIFAWARRPVVLSAVAETESHTNA